MDKKSKFNKVYANLPLKFRDEIVVVVDGQPITWNVAWIEIENNTDTGSNILAKLTAMKII